MAAPPVVDLIHPTLQESGQAAVKVRRLDGSLMVSTHRGSVLNGVCTCARSPRSSSRPFSHCSSRVLPKRRATGSGSRSGRTRHTLVGQNPDSLWVALPGRAAPVAVARRRAARLEVSRGWDRGTIRGAGIGAGLGAITGAVLGGVSASKLQSCPTPERIDLCSMEWYE